MALRLRLRGAALRADLLLLAAAAVAVLLLLPSVALWAASHLESHSPVGCDTYGACHIHAWVALRKVNTRGRSHDSGRPLSPGACLASLACMALLILLQLVALHWIRDLTQEGIEPNPGWTCEVCQSVTKDGIVCTRCQRPRPAVARVASKVEGTNGPLDDLFRNELVAQHARGLSTTPLTPAAAAGMPEFHHPATDAASSSAARSLVDGSEPHTHQSVHVSDAYDSEAEDYHAAPYPVKHRIYGSDSHSESDSEFQRQAEEYILEANRPAQAVSSSHAVLENFGMPLPPDRAVHRVKRRYLLSRSEGTPEFTEELRELFQHSHMGIRSPMDTGKSHAYIHYVMWLLSTYPTLRILLITSRITLACQLTRRLVEVGVPCVSYLDEAVKQDRALFHSTSCVIIQLDSLPVLNAVATQTGAFDVVLLDESESTLKHFSAQTMAARNDVWQHFKMFCSFCSQLILLDAFLGSRSDWWLRAMHATSAASFNAIQAKLSVHSRQFRAQLGPLHVNVVVNELQTDGKKYVEHATEVLFNLQLHQFLRDGKRLAIACNSKKRAKEMYRTVQQKYPHLRVRLYCSDTGEVEKRDIANCNDLWTQLDVVIYSPTVGAGVDFNPPAAHFDVVMALGVSTSNTCSDFMQMIGRIRKVISNSVHVFLQDFNKGDATVSFTCNEAYVLDELDRGWDTLNRHQLLDPMGRRLVSPFEFTYDEPLYKQLYVFNRVEAEQSRAMFSALFWRAVQDKGGTKEKAPTERTASEVAAHKQFMVAMAEKEFTSTCEQLVDERYADHADAQASRNRSAKSQSTARDLRLRHKEHLIEHYCLRNVSVHEPYSGPSQRQAMLEFVKLFRQATDDDRFRQFCRMNASLAHWHSEWHSKVHTRTPQNQPAELQDRIAYMRAQLTKGLMSLMGFDSRESPNAPAPAEYGDPDQMGHHRAETMERDGELEEATHDDLQAHSSSSSNSNSSSSSVRRRTESNSRAASPSKRARHGSSALGGSSSHGRHPLRLGDDGAIYPEPRLPTLEEVGDICSTQLATSSGIQGRLDHAGGIEWLQENAKFITGLFGNKIGEGDCGLVKTVCRLAKTVLGKVGMSCAKVKQRRSRHGGKRTADTSWKISFEPDSMSSMLELAFVIQTQGQAASSYRDLGDWDVRATLLRWKPRFRWELLTGVPQPYLLPPPQPLPLASSSDGGIGSTWPPEAPAEAALGDGSGQAEG